MEGKNSARLVAHTIPALPRVEKEPCEAPTAFPVIHFAVLFPAIFGIHVAHQNPSGGPVRKRLLAGRL